MEKKITLATVKSFIKNNREQLHILCKSSFDGNTDCVERIQGAAFQSATVDAGNHDHNFGIAGAWFVGQSRDYFRAYNEGEYSGIEVYNACGSFVLAIKKVVPSLNATEYKKQFTPACTTGDGKLAICRLNSEKQGIELQFSVRPAQSVVDDLNANRWRWHRANKYWYAKDNSISRRVASKYATIPEEVNQDAGLVDAQEQAAIANGNY